MFRIGEFSRLAQVTVKALRLYDERGLLVPARVDRASGYRFYSAAQLPRLQRILALKDLGLSLQEIGDLLDGGPDTDAIRDRLELRRTTLERELLDGRARLARVEAYLAGLAREGDMPAYDALSASLADNRRIPMDVRLAVKMRSRTRSPISSSPSASPACSLVRSGSIRHSTATAHRT